MYCLSFAVSTTIALGHSSCSRGSQGIGSWLACHEFDPSTTKDPPFREAMHVSRAQTSSRWCGVVVRRGGASSGVVLVT
ncbi:hypothetical protein TNCV_4723231 [Trichonephila clavipes]|uniref:Uncharacterized protein n=1 Tax=Trichonephila clavipes TaxID=2585209 RepID=A0A8X6W6I4_TRICX|nr:hypothetical protein TNCV_4723231 [Trichonephila clavipes]